MPEEDRIGEEGRGFSYILDSLNPERILIAAEAIGIGFDALPARPATPASGWCSTARSARTRASSIRWPSAGCSSRAPGGWPCSAAALYDAGEPCGAEANAAKFLGARAGHDAAWQAIATHGGFGYAKEYQVERLYREVALTRIAPITEQLILSFIAEKVLDLPKSY